MTTRAPHPNARPVTGPDGTVHPSATAARRVAGVGRGRFVEMLRDPASGWRYADGPAGGGGEP